MDPNEKVVFRKSKQHQSSLSEAPDSSFYFAIDFFNQMNVTSWLGFTSFKKSQNHLYWKIGLRM